MPIEATRLPLNEWSWSHCAECIILPAKLSMPGTSGSFGSVSGPMPLTNTLALYVPAVVSNAHPCSS